MQVFNRLRTPVLLDHMKQQFSDNIKLSEWPTCVLPEYEIQNTQYPGPFVLFLCLFLLLFLFMFLVFVSFLLDVVFGFVLVDVVVVVCSCLLGCTSSCSWSYVLDSELYITQILDNACYVCSFDVLIINRSLSCWLLSWSCHQAIRWWMVKLCLQTCRVLLSCSACWCGLVFF